MSSNVRFATRQVTGDAAASSGFNGLPFPTTLATAWDGATYFSGQPSGSNSEYIPVFGQGTRFPIGFLFEELFNFVWKVKYCDVTSTWTGVADDGSGEAPLVLTADYSYGSASSWFQNETDPPIVSFSSSRTTSEINDIILIQGAATGRLDATSFTNEGGVFLPSSYTFTSSPFDPNISAFFSVSWTDVTDRTGFECIIYFLPTFTVLRSIDNLYYPELVAEFSQTNDNGKILSIRGQCLSSKVEPTEIATQEIIGTFTLTGIGSVNLYFAGNNYGEDPRQSCEITLNPSTAYLWPYV